MTTQTRCTPYRGHAVKFWRLSARALFCFHASLSMAAAPEHLWIEGESLAERSFAEPAEFRPANEQERDVLSGGEWLAVPPGSDVRFPVDVPEDGEWRLWVRGHDPLAPRVITIGHSQPPGSYRWRFDEGEWSDSGNGSVPIDIQALDITASRYFAAHWKMLGKVKLKRGGHVLTIETKDDAPAIGLDCLCLTRDDFFPHGSCKPGETFERTNEGWFAFEPFDDAFEPSPIDMIATLHTPSGSKGVVQRQGDRLVFAETGETVRFWGVTACPDSWHAPKHYMDRLARELAKRGVNLVRFHAAPFYETEPGPSTEGIHYLCAQLKKNGIYYGFNWYCTAVTRYQEDWGWSDDWHYRDPLLQVAYYYPPFQKKYRQWAETLLNTPNPYTGMTLAEDPSTAYLELIDEDSMLWWAFNPTKNTKASALPYLERLWAAWVAGKYGSIQAAIKIWGAEKPPPQPDLPEEDRLALYPASSLTGAPSAANGRNEKRASDQLRFMVEAMRGFYRDTADWLKNDLGYRGPVLSTNWKTADAQTLGALEKYADCALDLTAKNNYFACAVAEKKFFPCNAGMVFLSKSFLKNPENVAMFGHLSHNDRPHFFTEGAFSMPNRFRSEEQIVQACYASLHGLDGIMPFVCQPDWNVTLNSPWPIQTAVAMGQYPAMSLIYRMGYIEEAPPVVEERIGLEDLFAFKGAPVRHNVEPDGNQAWAIPKDIPPSSGLEADVDPLVFYVGRLTRQVGDGPTSHRIAPELKACIDRQRKIVRSVTGQIEIDYGRGLIRFNAPKAQGVGGFLREAGPQETDQVLFDLRNEHAVAAAVCLDDRPLAESEKILLQVMTEETHYGREVQPVKYQFRWQNEPGDAEKLTRIGSGPLLVRNIEGAVSFKRPDAQELKVTALDAMGYPVKSAGAADRIDLEPDTIYYYIEK